MIKKIIFPLVLIGILSFSYVSNFRDLVIEKLEAYSKDYPEKTYVITDKPYYTLGEDIWFTAYLVNGINHEKSDKSKVVYVELVNAQDSILYKRQLYVKDISTAGDFKTEKTWKPGNYIIRAYTNYMRNKGGNYFFKKEIPVWDVKTTDALVAKKNNATATDERTQILKTEKPEISFYPESGNLVNGIASKLAIKVKDPAYKDNSLEGLIKDSNGKTITAFKTAKFGMCAVTITPETGKTYYASIHINGEEIQYPLPKALSNGYSLSVANLGSNVILKVSSNTVLGLRNSFLVAHQRGHLIYEKLETNDTNSYSVKLKTDKLTDGVASFTLFNPEGKPVCERLIYINIAGDDVVVQLDSNNTNPVTRDQIKLKVDLKDQSGNSTYGNLSLSITDVDAVRQSSKNGNLKTYLLLNSDLRGNLEDPGYFFEKENDPKRRYLLDLVMLTHGWRRFTWTDLLYKTTTESSFEAEKGLFISGRTKALNNENQNISAATRLTFLGPIPHQESKRSNVDGKFRFGPYIFHDTLPTLIESRVKSFYSEKTEDKKNRNVSIFIEKNNKKSPIVNRKGLLKPNLDDENVIHNFLKQAESISKINEKIADDSRLLDEVIIKANVRSEREKRNDSLDNLTLYGRPSGRIDLNNFNNRVALNLTTLLNMLPGVMATNDSVYIGRNKPSLFLESNQVELFEINYLTGDDIEFIDVLRGPDAAMYSNSNNGIIVIYLRSGVSASQRNIRRKPGIIDFESVGFYTAREFYAPDHIDGFEEATRQDVRTTLHWEPEIRLNETSKTAEITFFTCDLKSKYAIRIEGITDNGVPFYNVSTFEVD